MTMKPINRTPENRRCMSGTCPAVWEIEGDRLLIVGKNAGKELLSIPHNIGSDESAIVIDRALLADILPLGKVGQQDFVDLVKKPSGSENLRGPDWKLFQTPSEQVESLSGHPGVSFAAESPYVSLCERCPEFVRSVSEQYNVAIDCMRWPRNDDDLVNLLGQMFLIGAEFGDRTAGGSLEKTPSSQGQALSGHQDALLKAVHKAIVMEIQLRDFGHDGTDQDGDPVFVTASNQIEFMEECCLKAAKAVITLLQGGPPSKQVEALSGHLGSERIETLEKAVRTAKSLAMSQIMYWEQKGVEIPSGHPFRRDLAQFEAAIASAPRSSEEPALAGDTASPQEQGQPDTEDDPTEFIDEVLDGIFPKPITPETGH